MVGVYRQFWSFAPTIVTNCYADSIDARSIHVHKARRREVRMVVWQQDPYQVLLCDMFGQGLGMCSHMNKKVSRWSKSSWEENSMRKLITRANKLLVPGVQTSDLSTPDVTTLLLCVNKIHKVHNHTNSSFFLKIKALVHQANTPTLSLLSILYTVYAFTTVFAKSCLWFIACH